MPPIILAIPRGCFLSEEQSANPDQLIPHGVPLAPYEGSPDWTKSPVVEPAPIEPVVDRLEVTETVDDGEVVRLDPFVIATTKDLVPPEDHPDAICQKDSL